MSAIAYITDSKLLELHRLNVNKEMNFWRISTKTSFSDFGIGDLVFFLSKDKEHMKNKEKGIVGFGVLASIYTYAPRTMWNKFEEKNGYKSYELFKEAIIKTNKNHELPKKISSFYLNNVTFFQSPIYLSECKIEISKNVESYIYLKPEETVITLLDYAKNAVDIWSSSEGITDIIEDLQLEYAVKLAHNDIGDIKLSEKANKIAIKTMKKVQENNPVCHFIGNSKTDLCLVKEKDVLIVLYNNKKVDKRLLIGQSELYKINIMKYYKNAYKLYFKTSNGDKELDNLLNRY